MEVGLAAAVASKGSVSQTVESAKALKAEPQAPKEAAPKALPDGIGATLNKIA